MNLRRWISVSAVTVLTGACTQSGPGLTVAQPTSTSTPAAQVAGQGGGGQSSATMQFGQVDVGSQTPPGSTHDQSAHAKDNVVPGTVVIKAGGTVTFNIPASVHQIAIYKPGTGPDDINTSIRTTLKAFAGCVAPPGTVDAPLVINDSTNRFTTIPVPCLTPTQKTQRFDRPGKYLVICAFAPHFDSGMYGWVDVKD